MKILLINPPKETALDDGLFGIFKPIDVGSYPPLGLMYIATYIERYTDYDVHILDADAQKISFEHITKEIQNQTPDIVGVYTTSFTLANAYRIIRISKEINKNIMTIMGGPHLNLYPKETIALSDVDFIIIGEGEITMIELLNCIKESGDLHKIKGIAFKENDKYKFTDPRPLLNNLDKVLFPARHLLPIKEYYSLIGKGDIITTLMSSRGCPYRCSFCNILYGGRYRMRSADNVLDEIESCLKYGIKEFFFFDESFTINRGRVINICNKIIERNLNIIFDIRARVDTIDDEMLEKLKEAGCERIQFGIESGTGRILKVMNKRISIEQSRRAVIASKKAGLIVYADFMIGYPTETKEEIMHTIDFSLELNLDFVQFGITALHPGTEIYEDALKSGFLKEDYWRRISSAPLEHIVPPFASEIFSETELKEMLRLAYSKFYLRPRYILKRTAQINSFRRLFREAKAGYHLFLGRNKRI